MKFKPIKRTLNDHSKFSFGVYSLEREGKTKRITKEINEIVFID
jgi:hypothetical protein